MFISSYYSSLCVSQEPQFKSHYSSCFIINKRDQEDPKKEEEESYEGILHSIPNCRLFSVTLKTVILYFILFFCYPKHHQQELA